MKQYHEKLYELRKIVNPQSEKLRYPTPFKIYKSEVLSNAKKGNPEVKAKELSPKIKEEWSKLPRNEKLLYVLYSQKEKEKVMHERNIKKLEEEMEKLKAGKTPEINS